MQGLEAAMGVWVDCVMRSRTEELVGCLWQAEVHVVHVVRVGVRNLRNVGWALESRNVISTEC